MNLATLLSMFYRLFQGISMCSVFIRTCKNYSKLKMALTAAFEGVSLSPVGVSTCSSPNSVGIRSSHNLSVETCSEIPQPLASPPVNSASPYGKLKTFSSGQRIRNSSVHLQESLGTPINKMPTDQFQLASPRRPTLTALNQNCDGFSQGSDHSRKFGCGDHWKINGTSGFIEGNGMTLNRPPLAPNRRRPPMLQIPHLPISLSPCFQKENLAEELEKEIVRTEHSTQGHISEFHIKTRSRSTSQRSKA